MAAGRKEVAKFKVEKRTGVEEKEPPKSTLNRGFCSVWSFVTALTRDILVGPPTDIGDCLNAFFDASELKGRVSDCHCTARVVNMCVCVSQCTSNCTL